MAQIDVIIPVYNGEKYIEKCINSIAQQTYKNFRIICVNDGSTDNTANILAKLQSTMPNLAVINGNRGGVSAARNKGIDFAMSTDSNGYLSFVDSDDYVEPTFLEELYSVILTDNNVDLSVCGLIREDTEGNILSCSNLNTDLLNRQKALISMETPYFDGGIDYSIWNKLFRKALVGNLRINEKYYQHEDAEFLCCYLCKCNKIGISSKNNYHYVKNPDSYMSNIKMDYKFLSGYYARRSMVEIVRNESREAINAVNTSFIKHMITVGQKAVLEGVTGGLDSRKVLKELSYDAKANLSMALKVNLSLKLKLLVVLLAFSLRMFSWCVMKRYKS